MHPTDPLIEFLQGWEGPSHLSPREDPCAPGVFDIGFGHVCARNHPPVTPQWCEDTLRADAEKFAAIVTSAVTATLAPHEFDACTSLCFNIGKGMPGVKDGFVWLRSGQHSTVLKLINALDFEGAADAFRAWNKAGGVVVRGLKNRREAERAMFLQGDYSRRP